MTTKAGLTGVHLPDGTRSAQSPWVWRAFLFLSFIAFGLFLVLAMAGEAFYAICWAVITVGWFAMSMWLWRQHIRHDNGLRGKAPAAR